MLEWSSMLISHPAIAKAIRRIFVSAILFAFCAALPIHAQTLHGDMAPKPLFRDPVHDGAADPTLIWNQAKKQWWMFYTNRRADQTPADPKDVAWLHQTRIGIATSSDHGVTWKYRGIADIPYGKPDYTQWAPAIIHAKGAYHMFLTIVPGTFHDWNAPRFIIHLTSPDLEHWKFVSKLDLGSDRVIDACVFHLADGTWRLWYKDERDHSHIHFADSPDLKTWTPRGAAITDRSSEGPIVFRWHDEYWMIVDAWHGLGVYHSTDATHWQRQPDNLLGTPGTLPTDRTLGHHADVILSGQRGYLFYFTHQSGPDNDTSLPHSSSRTVIQVAEFHWKDGILTVDRNQPTHIRLEPGESNR